MEPIILASGSLRRQKFFEMMGLSFNVMVSNVDETYDESKTPQEVTAELARRKVNHIVKLLTNSNPPWICGADTVVCIDGQILGKAPDRDEAARMLHLLSGREHQAITSVALYRGADKHIDCRTVVSTVSFALLRDEEIEWYLNSGEWQGAAGAYKVQGLAACFIDGIKGSYSGVVGLPIREFYCMLRDNGYPYGSE